MLTKYILVLLFCCVYGVLSISPFFEKGQRPEIYELMDNEMPTLKISIPANEFNDLKEGMKYSVTDTISDLGLELASIAKEIKTFLKFLKIINYNEINTEINFKESFPQLKIGEDGYAQFDIEEVFDGYDYDPDHYTEEDFDDLKTIVFMSNKNFEIIEIIKIFLQLNATMNDDNIFKIEDNIIFETWEEEQIYKYVTYPIDNTFEEEIESNDLEHLEDNEDELNTGFKTKNATMTFEINGNTSSFDKVTFKLSGSLSKTFSKPSYNIKIKNGENLYGRSHFKLRSDKIDPTHLRSKLVSDIRNRVGIKSISANYIQLYINEEYMGLYIMTDVIDLPWIKDVYGEKKTTYLYKCNNIDDFVPENYNYCENKNEDVTDHSEWIHFLTLIENAKSASDLEDIFDVDHFLYEMAIDYLINAYDHDYHNFYFYKQPNGKWTYISYDFDLDFKNYRNEFTYEKYIKQINAKEQFYDLFISQDQERFTTILKDIVNKVINPATLYSHIDEIKQFLKPYVILDKTPDANGNYPGEINKNKYNDYEYTFEEWDGLTEFAIYDDDYDDKFKYDSYIGLKYLILNKYRSVCHELNMECDPIYIDENYLIENVENIHDHNNSYTFKKEISTEIPTGISTDDYTTSSSTEPSIEKETVYDVDEPTFSTDEESSFDEEVTTKSDEFISESITTKTITKTQTIIYTTSYN